MTTMPAEITYGHVTGRFIAAWTDGPDAGRLPDPRPLEGLTVKIVPKVQARRLAGTAPVLVATMPVTCKVDADGRLIDEQGNPGVWLVTGVYGVTYAHPAVSIPAHDIEVTDAHTEDTPLDLVTAMPPGGPVLTASQYAELSARIDALGSGGGGTGGTGAVSSVNGQTGAVVLDAADVGALPDTTPIPAEPADLGAATAAQGAKADTAVQPADVDDVVREGDSRLNDTRTPKAHTHTASEVSGLPDPQTLSLSGADLSLSGGGGTVTLPSGGGGGGAVAEQPLDVVGRWVTGASITSVGQATTTASGWVWPMPLPLPWGLTFDQVAVRVTTAEAGAQGKVLVYSVAGKEPNATLVWTSPTISLAATGDAIATTTAVTLPPGQYWTAFVHTMTTGQIRTYEAHGTFQGVGGSFNEASIVPKTGFRLNVGTFASPSASVVGASFYTGAAQSIAAVGFRRSA